MSYRSSLDIEAQSYGIALLRVSLGVMYLAHSVVLKLFTYTLPGTAQFFVGVGLPGWLAYVTFFAEAAGGVMLVLGILHGLTLLLLVRVRNRRRSETIESEMTSQYEQQRRARQTQRQQVIEGGPPSGGG